MCPLRLILIFLAATLAGFFLIRNLNSQPTLDSSDAADELTDTKSVNAAALPQTPPKFTSKVYGLISTGFWTCVDMASGRYLWRNLVRSSNSKSGD